MEQLMMSIEQRGAFFYAYIFQRFGIIAAQARAGFAVNRNHDGWASCNADEVFAAALKAAKEALESADKTYRDINALALSVERGAALVWDAKTGVPVCDLALPDCSRARSLCRDLSNKEGFGYKVRECCGTVIDHRFSAPKLAWILENVPDARQCAERGELLFGSMDSWLIWNFTGGKTHACDCSNAAYTMLYDIYKRQWDADLLTALKIPEQMLPDVKLSSADFGETISEYFGGPVKIACAAGNENNALFGQTCYDLGKARVSYGSTCDVIVHTGLSPVISTSNIMTTFAYGIAGINKYALHAPHWLDMCTDDESNLAACEKMAYRVYKIVRLAEKDTGCPVQMLHADGDAAYGADSDALLQLQADLLQIPVCRPAVKEVSALGSVYIAGVFTGFFKGRDDVVPYWKAEKIFDPAVSPPERDALVERLAKA
ncbi:MAG: FGGY family carbohydrate kinase [Treponema sp.]|nr:FGGY family carbohydrate kinase [Treponema sp.]